MLSEKAKWVTAGKECEAPIFHGTVSLPDGIAKAEISICGLGFFELYLGGRKVSEDLLVPAWSDYEPRENRRLLYPLSDTFSHRIYYMDYDILPYLKAGENKLEVWLGNGWYNQHVRNVEGDLWYDYPKLAYTITLTACDGTITEIHSDETLLWTKSPIVFNNVYVGETWDYQIDDMEKPHPVAVLPAPKSRLMRQTCPSDRVMDTRTPKLIGTVGEAKIYDVGENITGYVRCTGKGDVVIRYAENLYEDCSLNTVSASHSYVQKDEYHTDSERELCPKFSIKGFRYFEITGEVSDVVVDVVHADIPVTSSFDSDSEMLNWLYKTYLRTQLNNMHHGIVSDCPHRERLGYTGDGQVTCNAAMLLLGSHELFCKWIGDIMDCQDPKSGHVQHTAPFYGGGGGPGGWGCAVVVVPYTYYRHTGDKAILAECWEHMVKWVGYMEAHSENGLVVREEKDGWCLGDWCAPEKIAIPEPLVNTYYFIRSMEMMLDIADVLGDRETEKLSSLIKSARKALAEAYIDTIVQGADAFLADLGLLDEHRIAAMAARYDEFGCYDTGIFGTYVLTKVLFRHGYAETAYKLLTSEKSASFHNMKAHGATTLWENWDGRDSHDHPMFGAVTDCLFEDILGVRMTSPGFQSIAVEPHIPAEMKQVKGHITIPAGKVCVEYNAPVFKITVPDVPAYAVLHGAKHALEAGENLFQY